MRLLFFFFRLVFLKVSYRKKQRDEEISFALTLNLMIYLIN